MERDRQFEIRYVLSLALGIISFVSVGSLRDFAPVTLCYISLMSPAIQIVIFNISYTFETVYDFELDVQKMYNRIGRINIFLMTFLFTLIISNTILSWVIDLVGKYTSFSALPMDLSSTATLIVWLLSVVVVVLAGIPLIIGLFSARGLRDIDTTVGPPNPRITSNFRDSTGVYVRITNKTDRDQEFSITFDAGEELEWQMDGNTGTGECTSSLAVDAERRERIDLALRYHGDGSKSVPIDVKIEHPFGTQSKRLDAICRA